MACNQFVMRVLFFLTLFICFSCSKEAELVFEYVDPLQKVFPESNYFPPQQAHADVARGEHASFQFVVRANTSIKNLRISVTAPKNGDYTLSDIKKGFVGFVRDSRTNSEPASDALTPVSGFYPDPILYQEKKDVAFGVTQPIWLTVTIPKTALTGLYKGNVTIEGTLGKDTFRKTQTFEVEVYKPVIDTTSLWISNWFYLGKLSHLNNNKEVEKHGDRYWELTRILARKMSEYRQNTAKVSPFEHTEFEFRDGKWSFDFSNYNKMVALFEEEGVIGRLEGGHLARRLVPGWSEPYGLFVPNLDSGNGEDMKTVPLDDAMVEEFYGQFLPAFEENLKVNGWLKGYIQHIADEPNSGNIESYKEITNFIRTLMPNITVIEATHEYRLEDQIDIWVPQMATLKHRLDFYKERMQNGDEVWYYTCQSPKGEFANRFIGLPLIKTRLLHWVNFKYDVTGYLHWGFNFWGSGINIANSDDPYDDTSGIVFHNGTVISGGDSWIVYPGDNEIFPSIRLEAMRDGIVDYELLKMYQKKFPEKAKEMVDRVVFNFELYDTNIDFFRAKRRQMLQELSRGEELKNGSY